jgi:dipeptidyl aminopeptidase/acylaminoacyl peptidase
MRRALRIAFRVLVVALLLGGAILAITGIPAPPAFVTQDVPRVSWRWAWRSIALVRELQRQRAFAAWYGADRRMLVTVGTRRSFYLVTAPGAKPEPVSGLPTGASSLQWSRDTVRPYVVYALDEGGNERYRFYRLDLDTGASTPITARAARAYAFGFDPSGTRLAFTSSERNGVDLDVYVADVRRPDAGTPVYAGGGDYSVSGWLDESHLLLERLTSHSRWTLLDLDLNSGSPRPLFPERSDGVRILDATHDRRNTVMYLAADLDTDFASLHAFDVASGTTAPLLPELKWDVAAVQALADGRTLALLINEDAQNKLYLFDLGTRALRRVENVPPGFVARIAAHPTLPLLAADVVGLDGISGVWTYDAAANRWEAWAVTPPEDPLPPPEVVHYPTFDRAEGQPRLVPAIVMRTSTRQGGKQPVVIEVHGGPTDQALARVQSYDAVAFDGATVIRPNVRGSSGYGTRYESLDDREHRADAVRDIGALLDWIRTRPDLDSSRVGIFGGSYGGYMALAALTQYSDRLRCGVDLFGISDIPTFLKESERGFFPEAQRAEFGDWRDPQMLRVLQSLSPASHASSIRAPLMIYQGANDVRVRPSQSRSMADRIRAAGGRVTYIEAPNEGHGTDQPLTQFYVGVVWMEFMSRCLRN